MSNVEILGYLKKQLGVITKRLEETGVLTIQYRGVFLNLDDQTVLPGQWLTVLETEEAGEVDEFFIRSPDTNFKVKITVDGVDVLEKTYDELREVEQNSRYISAFAELDENGDPTGYFIASVRNIPHSSSVAIRVQNTGSVATTFPNVFVKRRVLGVS